MSVVTDSFDLTQVGDVNEMVPLQGQKRRIRHEMDTNKLISNQNSLNTASFGKGINPAMATVNRLARQIFSFS